MPYAEKGADTRKQRGIISNHNTPSVDYSRNGKTSKGET